MKLLCLLSLLGVVLTANASAGHYGHEAPVKETYGVKQKTHGYEQHSYVQQYNYHGKYSGKCGGDGMYYMDDYSFVFCTGQFAYVQPCPPGTMNSGYGKFQLGSNYNYRDFCDINLVDQGYGAKQHYSASQPKLPTYDHAPKKPQAPLKKQYLYHGMYEGQCSNDGFYYKDDKSFVMCSNGYSFIQPCAPGTRNSGYVKFAEGKSYYYRDFCDINLVDEGYGVHKGYLHKPAKEVHSYGYKTKEPHYDQKPAQYGDEKHMGKDSYGFDI